MSGLPFQKSRKELAKLELYMLHEQERLSFERVYRAHPFFYRNDHSRQTKYLFIKTLPD